MKEVWEARLTSDEKSLWDFMRKTASMRSTEAVQAAQ
jgi:hypothetical protein